jgi:DNA-binding MarR family transcriptional regulator
MGSSIVCVRTNSDGGFLTRVDRLTKIHSRPKVAANDKEYVLDDQVGHLLRRAHQRHTSIFQEHIGDSQLTPLQFAALVRLSDLGEVSQNRLGRLTAMDAATMQGVIRRLFDRDLIERRPDPTDRRRILLRLSPSGEHLLDTSIANGFVITDRTLEPLSPSERRTFLDLLRRIS